MLRNNLGSFSYLSGTAAHNLQLRLVSSILIMEEVTETCQFNDTTESVYIDNFFGHSIDRWQKLENIHDRSCSNPTLKALTPTW